MTFPHVPLTPSALCVSWSFLLAVYWLCPVLCHLEDGLVLMSLPSIFPSLARSFIPSHPPDLSWVFCMKSPNKKPPVKLTWHHSSLDHLFSDRSYYSKTFTVLLWSLQLICLTTVHSPQITVKILKVKKKKKYILHPISTDFLIVTKVSTLCVFPCCISIFSYLLWHCKIHFV